jgi:uncharacterized protein YpmB
MARLAIRATGDRSKRESVTTGERHVIATITEYNSPILEVEVRHSDGETTYVVYEYTFGKRYMKHSTITYWDKTA